MNDRNGEGAGVAIVIGIAIVIGQLVLALIAAISICITAALSVMAVIALVCDGITIFGEHTSRTDAIKFFVRGAAGAVALPLFLALVCSFLPWEALPWQPKTIRWVVFAGFAFGSWGIEIIEALVAEEQAKTANYMVLPPLPEHEIYVPPAAPTVEPVRPFQFASWKDGESRQ